MNIPGHLLFPLRLWLIQAVEQKLDLAPYLVATSRDQESGKLRPTGYNYSALIQAYFILVVQIVI